MANFDEPQNSGFGPFNIDRAEEYLRLLRGQAGPLPIPGAQPTQDPESLAPAASAAPLDVPEAPAPSDAAPTQPDAAWHPPMVLPSAPAAAPEVKPESQGIDFGQESGAESRMTDALQSQNNMNLIANLGQSFDKVGQAIAGTKAEENPIYGAIRKQASEVPGQYKALREDDKHDPNSALSKGFRDYVVNELHVPIKGNPSADDLSSIAPYLWKNYEARLAEKGKLEQHKLTLQTKAEEGSANRQNKLDLAGIVAGGKETSASSKEDKDAHRRGDELNKRLTAETQSSRSAFGKSALNYQSVQNAKALLEGNLDYNSLDTRETYELAKTLDRILSQGQPTASGAAHLTPDTAKSWLSKKIEFITSERQGAGLGNFIKRYENTFNREEAVAKKQMIDTQGKILSPYLDLYKKHPEIIDNVLAGQNLPPYTEMITKYQKPSGSKDNSSAQPGALNEPSQPLAPQPKSVIQNGHTYYLNPDTGKYE